VLSGIASRNAIIGPSWAGPSFEILSFERLSFESVKRQAFKSGLAQVGLSYPSNYAKSLSLKVTCIRL